MDIQHGTGNRTLCFYQTIEKGENVHVWNCHGLPTNTERSCFLHMSAYEINIISNRKRADIHYVITLQVMVLIKEGTLYTLVCPGIKRTMVCFTIIFMFRLRKSDEVLDDPGGSHSADC